MCSLCDERGKDWEGDDPRCGFDAEGRFVPDNWSCATLGEMHRLMEDVRPWEAGAPSSAGWGFRDDISDAGSFGVLRFPGGYLCASWYKDRSTIGRLIVMNDDEEPRVATLQDVLDAIHAAGLAIAKEKRDA